MTSPLMSRRDWLRPTRDRSTPNLVRPPRQQVPALQPVQRPPNHDGMNLADLPPVREARLDMGEVSALLDDIQQHGSDIQLMQRRNPRQRGQPNGDRALAWEAVRQAFLDGTLSKLQIRYRWQSSLWIDTLEHIDGAVRLVRVEHKGQ